MQRKIEQLETQLDSFDVVERRRAMESLCDLVAAGMPAFPKPTDSVNLHCHTFFSYNSFGYSPSRFAYMARKQGLAAAGIVDFDVLDGADEFLDASRLLDLKGCAGLETRVFIPEFAEREINSPGEPGISYHMGIGFPRGSVPPSERAFLESLKNTAQARNRQLVERVNRYLDPVMIDYDGDVLPLTPAGNPTERHICLAYAREAALTCGDMKELSRYWTSKLDRDIAIADMPEGRELLNAIRAKTMKRGGPGYVRPDGGSFPTLSRTNEFILACGGIPCITWLNGFSEGERALDELLNVAVSAGVAAINIIPDRNYGPGVDSAITDNLYRAVDMAERLGLPVVAGTEMNAPGQKFVDDFDSPELRDLGPVFLKGAYVVYGHSVLQRAAGLGYTSQWAGRQWTKVADKNVFYEKVGRAARPALEARLAGMDERVSPEEVLGQLGY